MPNEFKVRNGLIVDSGVSVISGSLIVLGGITGSLSGSSTGGGGGSAFPFTGSAQITGSLGVTGSSNFNGSVTITGSLIVTGGITGSISGSGGGATSITENTIISSNAGPVTASADSVFLGNEAAFNAVSSSEAVFIGKGAGYNSIARFGVFIGNNAGRNVGNIASPAFSSIFLGVNAGTGATNAASSIFLGSSTGFNAISASNAVFIGNNAGNAANSASFAIMIGSDTGTSAVSASRCIIIGNNSGRTASGTGISSNNIIIGSNISLPNDTTNSINIGGVLFGTNTYADFSGAPLTGSVGNGRIGINIVNPSYNLDVTGTGNFTNNVTISGSLIVLGGITGSGGGGGSTFPFTGSAEITGSLTVTGSVSTTGILRTANYISIPNWGVYGTDSGTNFLVYNNANRFKVFSGGGAAVMSSMIVGYDANNVTGLARLNVRGSGTTPATTTVRIENSAQSASLIILDNNSGLFNGNFTFNGGAVITGSLTVVTGSNVEFRVTNTGVALGSVLTDIHTATGSFNVTGSSQFSTVNVTGNTVITGSLVVLGGITGDDPGASFPFTGSAGITGSLTVIGPTRLRGPLIITGSGTTSSTSGLLIVNSTGSFGLRVRDDNTTVIRSLIIAPDPALVPTSGTGSLVIAPNFSTAGSDYSLIIGDNIQQGAGRYGFAIGNDITIQSSSLYSLNIGRQLTTLGQYTTNIGLQNTSRGNYNTVFGQLHTVSGSYNSVFGQQNTMVSGNLAAVFGVGNIIRSSLSFVAGTSNTSVGGILSPRAMILGDNNSITGTGGGTTWCIGTGLSGSSAQQIVLGYYNLNIPSAGFIIGSGIGNTSRANALSITYGDGSTIPTTIEMTGSILISGSHTTRPALNVLGNTVITGSLTVSSSNATQFQVGSNRLFISSSGNIGIGTGSPTERLHIAAAGNGSDVPLLIRGNGTKGGGSYLDFLCAENTNAGNLKKYFRINEGGGWEVVNDAYSNTIFTLDDSGNLNIAGTLTQNSDISLKTNIQTIPNALEKTLQLRGVEYDRISTNKHEIGLIAQEVEQVLPEVISETNGIKSVAYSNIISILIESIKELKLEIDDLRKQINK